MRHHESVTVLNLQERDDWDSVLREFPAQWGDTYFTAGYHGLYEINRDGTAECAVVRNGGTTLFVPGLRVPLPNSISEASGCAESDFQSCNGYAGPLVTPGVDRTSLEETWKMWKETYVRRGTVAAFFRLHPLLDNDWLLPADATVQVDRRVVYLDLSLGSEALLRAADGRHRNMVSKGRRLKTQVVWNNAVDWSAFTRLYLEAMARLDAPPRLRHDSAYFSALATLPTAELATVHDDHGLAAAAVFLRGPQTWHYHLSARRSDSANHLMNILLESGIERAIHGGAQGLLLGGGITSKADDPLLKFKRGLGGRLVDFKVALVVVNQPKFTQLIETWSCTNHRTPSWLLGYRQPAV
jgi:hypothetical protein